MICVCNSLAFLATHEGSDIDFFIVTDPRRMWLVRVFATGILWLTGNRRANLWKNSQFEVFSSQGGNNGTNFLDDS